MEDYLNGILSSLLPKLLASLREQLFAIIKTKDGVYTLLLIKRILVAAAKAGKEHEAELELIWQEMHVVLSKLTQTRRKVHILKRTGSSVMDSSFS